MQVVLTLIAVDVHGPVSLVVFDAGGVGTVDRNLVVVGTKPVTVRVRVGKQTPLWSHGEIKTLSQMQFNSLLVQCIEEL